MVRGLAVRPAAPADEGETVALWHACGLVVSHNDPGRDFRFARGKVNSDVLLGFETGGRLIGSVMVGHDGHRGWLYYLAAHPDMRGRGVGRAMVAAAEHWLRDRDVPKVQLLVRNTNVQVVAFYECMAFEPSQVRVLQKWL